MLCEKTFQYLDTKRQNTNWLFKSGGYDPREISYMSLDFKGRTFIN